MFAPIRRTTCACPITASTMSSCAPAMPPSVHGHYTKWLRERRADGDALRGPENQLPHDYVLPQAWRTALPEELYPTSYVVERTLAWLDGFAKRKDGAPFFLQCSFPDPHHPFTPPGRYWDMYKPADMALPDSFRIGNRPQPPHVAALHRRARQRHARRQHPAGLRGERARDPRGDRADLRHDHHDRRRRRQGAQAPGRAWARQGHRRHLHQRPRRPDGRPSADAERRVRLSRA